MVTARAPRPTGVAFADGRGAGDHEAGDRGAGERGAGGGAVGVRLTAVHKRYRRGAEEVMVLDGVELAVEPGEFAALVGPSGAGKSTLLQLVAGLEEVTAGRVEVGGAVVSELNDDERARLRLSSIGFVFQTFQLIPTLSALENAVLPLLLTGVPRKAAEAEGAELLEELGLTTRLAHTPDELSVGEKQRVSLARALISRPALLLADEPTANLDGPSTDDVMRLLRGSAHKRGHTVILATHDARAAAYADVTFTLRDGVVGRGYGQPH
ncbi:MAG TPA: ABC transporter ATP-binding protein [Trueperaceae bacterium]|nr:ABC transporter ATP-binding protein [Trueperaceae bacterium]